MLVEIQALVDHSMMANPRAAWQWGWNKTVWQSCWLSCTGHGGLQMADQGCICERGRRREGNQETSADLALLLAMVSSLRDRPLPQDLVVFGEVGLAGRSARCPAVRNEFQKRRNTVFAGRIVPAANVPKKRRKGCRFLALKTLRRA